MDMHRWLEDTKANILREGWVVQWLGGHPSGTEYAHTIGLTHAGLPELVLFAAPPKVAGMVLNDLARQSLADDLRPGELYTVDGADRPFIVSPMDVDHAQMLLRAAVTVLDKPVTAMQVEVRL